jgi:hypothetical protein
MSELPEKNWGAEPTRKPTIGEDEREVISECGRVVNNVDYRSHWLVVVRTGSGAYILLVKHGGGEERIPIGHYYRNIWINALPQLDTNQRYLTLYTIYTAHKEARHAAIAETERYYHLAFLEGRMKRRKKNRKYYVQVLPPFAPEAPTHA